MARTVEIQPPTVDRRPKPSHRMRLGNALELDLPTPGLFDGRSDCLLSCLESGSHCLPTKSGCLNSGSLRVESRRRSGALCIIRVALCTFWAEPTTSRHAVLKTEGAVQQTAPAEGMSRRTVLSQHIIHARVHALHRHTFARRAATTIDEVSYHIHRCHPERHALARIRVGNTRRCRAPHHGAWGQPREGGAT